MDNLYCVLSADIFAKSTVPPPKICNTAAREVLQVHTKNIIIGNLTSIVRYYIFVIKQLESVNLLLESFYLLLIKALEWVYKLDFFNYKHLCSINIHSFVHFSSNSLANELALHPL